MCRASGGERQPAPLRPVVIQSLSSAGGYCSGHGGLIDWGDPPPARRPGGFDTSP
jgi:hypothetical protein